MGCTNSVAYTNEACTHFQTTQKQSTATFCEKTNLTKEEKNIIKSTWKYMTEDLSGNGLQVFLRIFETCPEAKKLFKVENVRHSELARNPVIRGHGSRFMNAIGAAVDSLEEDDGEHEKLNKILIALGHQHKRSSGFKPEYFEVFYKALMWRWEQCMGENFTPEVSGPWCHVFFYMLENLKEGYFSKEI